MTDYLLALDQGTTSSRAILFTRQGSVVSSAQIPFSQYYPQPGWVEHDPLELLDSQLRAAAQCVAQSGVRPGQIAGVGLANQRETALMWERETGKPVGRAIVWQCRRTAAFCTQLREQGYTEAIRARTGLLPDAYFSGTKYRWLLEHTPGARRRAERGELLCGTVDSWLLWNLTGGKVHASDYSNCCRTMLFDIHRRCWDETLCQLLDVPMGWLPQPVENSGDLGTIASGVPHLQDLAGLPIRGAAGDQQAALFGHGCYAPGMSKNTYGTGCFLLMNTGLHPVKSVSDLITTIAWQLDGQARYALEGSVFVAGAVVKWLRDEMGLIASAAESEALASSIADNGNVYFVPAFTGLGAPHWDMYSRGTIVGLTRGTGRAHIVRAALEAIAYQSADVLEAMSRDSSTRLNVLHVDGGASANDFLMQFQADILGTRVQRPAVIESTALGAAMLAGRAVGLWSDEQLRGLGRSEREFVPNMDEATRRHLLRQWHRAVEKSSGWEEA